MAKATKHADSAAGKIRMYLRANPTATPKKVAEVFNVTAQYISVIKHGMKKAGEKVVPLKAEKSKRPTPQKWKLLHIGAYDNSIEAAMEKEADPDAYNRVHPVTGKILMQGADPLPVTMHDPVNHPEHYKYGGIETIDFIEAKELNYNMGNAVKYITRADHKGNRKQDLEKAIWYLKRELGI